MRFPFEVQIASLPLEVQQVHRTTWNAITDLQGAIGPLKAQIDSNKTAIDTVTDTVNESSSSETVITTTSSIGTLNNQSGVTAYSTTQADYGAAVLFNDASAIAVTLTTAPVIQLPWFAWIFNEGVGLVTATPATGTISYPGNLGAGSMPVPSGAAAYIEFDGTNFYAILVSGLSGSGVTGYIPKWTSSTAIGDSHIDDGVTTAGTVTSSEPVNVTGDITTSGLYHSFVYSAAGTPLPSAATAGAGARGFVSDATTNVYGTAYTSGGTITAPVYSDGTNWYMG